MPLFFWNLHYFLNYGHFLAFSLFYWIMTLFNKNGQFRQREKFRLTSAGSDSIIFGSIIKDNAKKWWKILVIASNQQIISTLPPLIVIFYKQNGHIFLIWAKNKKIRTLFLLQLLILKKRKCIYFLDLRPLGLYGYFLIFMVLFQVDAIIKMTKL